MLSHEEVIRLYGPWVQRSPEDAADFFSKYTGRWWIAGGWAIDAFTGSTRKHGDLNIGIPLEDIKEFISFASSNLDVWAAAGSLTPLSRVKTPMSLMIASICGFARPAPRLGRMTCCWKPFAVQTGIFAGIRASVNRLMSACG